MKIFKASGLIWILVALVVGYAYIYEYKGKQEQEKQDQDQKRLFTMEPDDITGFTLKNAKGTSQIELERDVWQVREPYKDQADRAVVHGFLQSLLDERFEEVVADGESLDPTLYGLQDATSVEIRSPKSTTKVYLGSVNALAGKKYLSLEGSHKVVLANATWEALLNKDPSEFRKKDIIDIPIRTISKIELSGKTNMTLLQENSKWKIQEFKHDDLDVQEVDSYVGSLMNLRASQFDSNGAPAKKKILQAKIYTHLAEPTILDIYEPEGTLSRVISNQREVGFKISSSVALSFTKTLDDFRDRRRPLKFDKTQITRIRYNSDLATVDIKKSGANWIWAGEGEHAVDSAQVERFLNKLSNMKVKAFLGKDIPFQKSGLITLTLGADTTDVLNLEWSPRVVKDFFVTKSSLIEEYVGLLATDVQDLPIQTMIRAPEEKSNSPKSSP